jgi:hypothetical protein
MFWGILLLLVGGLLMLDNLGFLPMDAGQLLWPGLIILIGLWILLRGRLYQAPMDSDQLSLPRQGAARAQLKLHHGAGTIDVRPGADPGALLSGSFLGGVTERHHVAGERAEVDLSVPSNSWWGIPWGEGRGFEWAIRLPEDVDFDITVEAGAGEINMDLQALQVSNLELKTGASSSKIHLPAHINHCRVKVEAGAAEVKLYLPTEMAARVKAEMGLAELKIDNSRFSKTGSGYETAEYAAAPRKIDIDIEAGVSSVEII